MRNRLTLLIALAMNVAAIVTPQLASAVAAADTEWTAEWQGPGSADTTATSVSAAPDAVYLVSHVSDGAGEGSELRRYLHDGTPDWSRTYDGLPSSTEMLDVAADTTGAYVIIKSAGSHFFEHWTPSGSRNLAAPVEYGVDDDPASLNELHRIPGGDLLATGTRSEGGVDTHFLRRYGPDGTVRWTTDIPVAEGNVAGTRFGLLDLTGATPTIRTYDFAGVAQSPTSLSNGFNSDVVAKYRILPDGGILTGELNQSQVSGNHSIDIARYGPTGFRLDGHRVVGTGSEEGSVEGLTVYDEAFYILWSVPHGDITVNAYAAFGPELFAGQVRNAEDGDSPDVYDLDLGDNGFYIAGTGDAEAADRTALLKRSAAVVSDVSDTCDGAQEAQRDVWLEDRIHDASDVDWFRVRVPSTSWLRAVLGSLPANLRLDLYRACDDLIASSQRPGFEHEEIYTAVAGRTYRLRVSSADGSSSGRNYALRIGIPPAGLQVIGFNTWNVDSENRRVIAGEVLNNANNRVENVMVRATLAAPGKTPVFDHTFRVSMKVIRGRDRSPFSFKCFCATAAANGVWTFRITSSRSTSDLVSNLPITNIREERPGNELILRGAVTNRSSTALTKIDIYTTLYDNRGNIIGTRRDGVFPTPVQPGGTATFKARFDDHYDQQNRVGFQAQAIR